MKDYSSLERDLAAHFGMNVIVSDLVPDGKVYLVPVVDGMPLGPIMWEEVPEEPRWEVVQIVQDGLADVLTWLRRNGHYLPTWQQQRDSGHRWEGWSFRAEERMMLDVGKPGVFKVTS